MAKRGSYLGGSTIIRVRMDLFVGLPPTPLVGGLQRQVPDDPSKFVGKTSVVSKGVKPVKKKPNPKVTSAAIKKERTEKARQRLELAKEKLAQRKSQLAREGKLEALVESVEKKSVQRMHGVVVERVKSRSK